jgi:hypothetical protein
VTDAVQSAGLVALAERIELWPIARLRPYERNPRTHSDAQVDQIAAAMVEVGYADPILIDENADIPADHGRPLAAPKLDPAEFPVIRFEPLFDGRGGCCFPGISVAFEAAHAPSAGLQERDGGEARAGPCAAQRGA